MTSAGQKPLSTGAETIFDKVVRALQLKGPVLISLTRIRSSGALSSGSGDGDKGGGGYGSISGGTGSWSRSIRSTSSQLVAYAIATCTFASTDLVAVVRLVGLIFGAVAGGHH